jgi:hypothetical protein
LIAGAGSFAEASASSGSSAFCHTAAKDFLKKKALSQAAARFAGRTIGMGLAAPVAALEEVASLGAATPTLLLPPEVGAGLAGGWIRDKIYGWLEKLSGLHGTIEQARKENPMLSEWIGKAAYLPMLGKSALNLAELEKQRHRSSCSNCGVGAAGGLAFYPVQVGFDNVLQLPHQLQGA